MKLCLSAAQTKIVKIFWVVNTSLPTSKSSKVVMCTFMSYGKSEIIGPEIKEKDGKKFVNMNFNLTYQNNSNQIS